MAGLDTAFILLKSATASGRAIAGDAQSAAVAKSKTGFTDFPLAVE